MADISDVENAIANTVSNSLYPLGPSQASTVGCLCRVYRGWPNSATLNSDLAAGIVNVTVVTDNDSGRTTTRYLAEWQYSPVQPGATATASGSAITIGGAPVEGDMVGALIDRVAYAYRVQTGDSTELVASNLAQLIQSDRMVLVQGYRITVPGAGSVAARSVHDCTSTFESRRQEKDVRIICWCPTPPARDSVAAAIDTAINELAFLALADSTAARIIYRNTTVYDQSQNALLYRRDLLYTVEYPTVTILDLPSMIFGAASINGNITYG
jgi:hypothetical protein